MYSPYYTKSQYLNLAGVATSIKDMHISLMDRENPAQGQGDARIRELILLDITRIQLWTGDKVKIRWLIAVWLTDKH